MNMREYKIVFMRIREYLRKNTQTSWGKNQLITLLDEMEKRMDEEETSSEEQK